MVMAADQPGVNMVLVCSLLASAVRIAGEWQDLGLLKVQAPASTD